MVQKGSRFAAIYDVHGNLPALEAILADLQSINPDLIVVGGDVVAGPMPAEVLDRLVALSESIYFVRGNADREVVAAYDEGHYATEAADPAERTLDGPGDLAPRTTVYIGSYTHRCQDGRTFGKQPPP
jgi:predicted phosphodiesterase